MATTATTCPRCAAAPGSSHGYVHTRYGNGGGGNRPCPVSETELRDAARSDVRAGLAGAGSGSGTLVRILPGIGTETPDPDDVAIVSRIVGYDVRTRATGTYGRPNVALLRSCLRRWAVRESCGLRPTDGAA